MKTCLYANEYNDVFCIANKQMKSIKHWVSMKKA